ncbi:monoamine oxidase [Sphingobium sp. OAS761]|uniref:flavin monoamine oxidase family protein n=1 Tax=Sphingobium sp. OAS761 TaxID=2817901 RepID=UPI0020A0CCAF|nr:NAD(P)/FAD-dependent oxidoreductase [Sphingobium sp. OAS761]MCP1468407.1 monoamine oxidase [Sphingobium sp. OAS761]
MSEIATPSRRQLLTLIGRMGGAAAMYQAMTALGHAAETQFDGPPVLSGAKPGASVVVLGAGLAGMVAAYELEKAGYAVKILEFQDRPGGRNYSLRGGDTFTESDGTVQKVQFAPGNYINPGPWRIPHHHKCVLHYCRQFGVALEPFIQLNHNGFIHASDAFGGKPVRYKEAAVDFKGHTSELLAKALNSGSLDQSVTGEDKERLLEALRGWGVLDDKMAYTSSVRVSSQRGYDRAPGGGVDGAPTPSQIASLSDVLAPQVWTAMSFYFNYVMQTTMFQPVGGMDMIGKAFASRVGKSITYNAKVTKVAQNGKGVTVSYKDVPSGKTSSVSADWCVCTIPLSIISQVEMQVSPKMAAALKAVPYSGHIKMGMEFKRRFWEEDDNIYGGHSFTDQAIGQLSYPNDRMFSQGPAVLLGAFTSGAGAFELAGMTPQERIEAALTQGEIFHPQYRKEFLNGVSVPWTRVPWILGCVSHWSEEGRAEHYQDLVAIDGRIAMAGEHASYYGGWMEGSMLSGLDAISRIHKRSLEA